MNMWAEETLGELCSLITDGKHGDCRNEDDSGYYFISCKDVRDGQIHYENSRQIVHGDFAETHRRTDLGPGDVLLTNSGTIGRLAIAPDDEKTQRTTFQKSVAILKPLPKRITSHFLYYSLAANRARLINSAGGAAQKNLLLGELRRFTIRVPPLAEQAKIASTLSAYDDLIENNRRRIQLLEQAARLLYKEWFVHLRFPGHEHVTITNGVPEGWEKKKVKDVPGKVRRPRKIKKSDFLKEGAIPCVDQSRGFIGGYTDDEEAALDIGQPVIVFGDHTRILKFVDFPFACGADGTQLIVSNDEAMSQEFLYFALDAIDLSNYFYARHFKFLKDQYIPRPPNMLLSQFTDNAQPILGQIKSLRDHCHYLSKARDLLLPRLMNGGVVV